MDVQDGKNDFILPAFSPYDSYEAWKSWDKLFTCSKEQVRYFRGECRGVKIEDADVLEIGFGSGSFIAWAAGKNARLVGVEINPVLLKKAREFGLDLLPNDFESVANLHTECFDSIAAFDVFEHFTTKEIFTRLKAIETMLRPGGHLILRFPNGQSPFGLAPQNGDLTHRVALSRSIFEQLIYSSGLEVVRYGPAFRVMNAGLVSGFIRCVRYFFRDMIALFMNAIYAQSIPWDPVVVLVLQKTEAGVVE